MDPNLFTVSNSFDQDFGSSNELMVHDSSQALGLEHDLTSIQNNGIFAYDYSNDFMDYQDPLKHAYKHQFQPFVLDVGNTHFVNPHYVDGYFRSDGTFVEGYFRDGDGNTSIDRSAEQGGGYIRSNPDGNPFNNLK